MERDLQHRSDPLQLLRARDPVGNSLLTHAGVQAALDDLGAATIRQPQEAPGLRRSRAARRTAVVVASVLAITAGVATGAAVLSAHTGLFPTKAEQVVGGPGEALNPAAADFQHAALQVASDIPYPTQYASWREWILKTEASPSAARLDVSTFPAGLVSTGALHGWFAASAFCAWIQSWRQAALSGDAAASTQATDMIVEAPRWPAVTDEDPHPSPSKGNDSGAATGTLFGWMLPYRDAVVVGNVPRVEQLLASGYGAGKCWLSDPNWMSEVRAHRNEWGSLSQRETAQKYEQFLAQERP